jgi:hypothetical protein
VIQIFSTSSPLRRISASTASTSPPGSMTAAFIVFAHQTTVQFWRSGVTGATKTPIGDWVDMSVKCPEAGRK